MEQTWKKTGAKELLPDDREDYLNYVTEDHIDQWTAKCGAQDNPVGCVKIFFGTINNMK